MFFGSRIRGIVSDFRSDESFPVKTGSCRKMMVDPSFLPQVINVRFNPELTGKIRYYPKISDSTIS